MISKYSETYLRWLDMKACSHPMGEISSGSELDDGTNQDGKLPMNVLTAATKTRLSPGFYANILSLFEECFQTSAIIIIVLVVVILLTKIEYNFKSTIDNK